MFRDVKDSDWSADHIAAHGVVLDEVREVILERPYVRRRGRDNTLHFYGRTSAGRYLFVVAVRDTEDPQLAFVVTARDMEANERRRYKREVT